MPLKAYWVTCVSKCGSDQRDQRMNVGKRLTEKSVRFTFGGVNFQLVRGGYQFDRNSLGQGFVFEHHADDMPVDIKQSAFSSVNFSIVTSDGRLVA